MAILLTWNPANWDFDEGEYDRYVHATENVNLRLTWSVGRRRHGIQLGERAYLLRQGVDRRGIVASGIVDSEPYDDPHWDGSSVQTGYIYVVWEHFSAIEDRLDISVLLAEVPGVNWNSIRGSGRSVSPDDEVVLDRLLRSRGLISDSASPDAPDGGLISDVIRRVAIERYAVKVAREYLHGQGWRDIEDVGKPYDLRCKKSGIELHVEVKGTTGRGERVILTRGEVEHARTWQPTTLIVVRDIELSDTQPYVASGGSMRPPLDNWQPDVSDLHPTQYEYSIPSP